MKKIFFLSIIFINFHELLMDSHNCPTEYPDCFNCTTCGESELYYENCPCQWDDINKKCNSVSSKYSIQTVYDAFYNCKDTNSIELQNKFCGTTSINLKDKFNFSLPFVDGAYGARSIYCEYYFKASGDEDKYYNFNYQFNTDYSEYIDGIHLYVTVRFNDFTSSNANLKSSNINKDLYSVSSMTLKLYFEGSFPSLPFSLIITEKDNNSKMALYITIGIIVVACIICALGIYCLSKKISENSRLRQRALFEMAVAHQQGEVDNEELEQQKLETENKLKINFALKHALKGKKFLKKYGTKDGNICTICIEDFKENKSKVSITPCKHVFHYQCLSNWLINNVKNPKCPNCNKNLIEDVKDSDIQQVIKPERIEVNKIRVDNIGENENGSIRTSENRINVEHMENTRNVNNNDVVINRNTESRALRTSQNETDSRRNNHI